MQAMLSGVPVKTKNNSMLFFCFHAVSFCPPADRLNVNAKSAGVYTEIIWKRKKIFIRSRRVHESLLIHLKKAQTVDARQVFSLVWFIEVKSRKKTLAEIKRKILCLRKVKTQLCRSFWKKRLIFKFCWKLHKSEARCVHHTSVKTSQTHRTTTTTVLAVTKMDQTTERARSTSSADWPKTGPLRSHISLARGSSKSSADAKMPKKTVI